MGEYFDMPALVDRDDPDRRFGGASPMMIGRHNPFPGAPDPWAHPAAQPQSWAAPGAFHGPSAWGGYDSQAGTPMSWGSSAMSTPMVGAVPGVAVMPSAFPVSSEGWPRPLAIQPVDNTPPWKDRDVDDGSDRRLVAPRANTPLSRSISLSSSPSSTSLSGGSLSRKTSLRTNAAEALKRPPREWRTDFSLTGNGLLSGLLLGTRGRSKSFGGGGNSGDPKVVLHPYIRYTASKPPMTLDLRLSPNQLKFRALKDRSLTSWDLMRFVCEPPLPFMRFYHTHLPWYIDVEAQNPAGVTLYDLFYTIYQCMMTQIQSADYWNVEMNADTRAQVAEAWAERCRTEEERSQGIRRVDYLMGRVIMEGIQKGKDGLWEIKTRKPNASDS